MWTSKDKTKSSEMSEQSFWHGGIWRLKVGGRQISAQYNDCPNMEGQLLESVRFGPQEVFKQGLEGQGVLEGSQSPVGSGIGRYVGPFHP